jgi:hypothetical protein
MLTIYQDDQQQPIINTTKALRTKKAPFDIRKFWCNLTPKPHQYTMFTFFIRNEHPHH